MALTSKALAKLAALRALLNREKGLARRFLGGTRTEARMLRAARQQIEQRANAPYEVLVAGMRKAVLSAPPHIQRLVRELEEIGARMAAKVKARGRTFAHPAWKDVKEAHWARVAETARSERLPGNVKGSVREILIFVHPNSGHLENELTARLATVNAQNAGRGVWQDPTPIRGALQRGKGVNMPELGDVLHVSLADPQNLPRIKGKRKRLWIMAILESKSPGNMREAFEQLVKDVKRVLEEGIVINGDYFAPDDIHVELPTPLTKSKDRVTSLIAVLPTRPTPESSAGRALDAVAQRAVIDIWPQDVPEKEIEAAADLAISEVAAAAGEHR